jgi:hypothetical protein
VTKPTLTITLIATYEMSLDTNLYCQCSKPEEIIALEKAAVEDDPAAFLSYDATKIKVDVTIS